MSDSDTGSNCNWVVDSVGDYDTRYKCSSCGKTYMTQADNPERQNLPDHCIATPPERDAKTERRQKSRLLLDLHERLDDPDDNVTAEELQTALMMAAEELEKEQ